MVSEACPTNPREEASGLDPEAVHGLFVTGFPRFLRSLSDDPAAAVRSDPVSPLLVVVGMALVVSLVALIVTFGAKHGPAPGKTETSDNQQQSEVE